MSLIVQNSNRGVTKSLPLSEICDLVDRMEAGPTIELPVVHRFTPGMYVRELHVPKGAMVVTKFHHSEHPYVISQGKIAVWTEEAGVVTLAAPHCGITKPGTIRLAIALEDTIWTTFHATNKTDVSEIERELVSDPREVLQEQRKLCLLES